MPYIPYCYKYVYRTISHVNKIVFTNSIKSKSPRQTFRSRHVIVSLHCIPVTHTMLYILARGTRPGNPTNISKSTKGTIFPKSVRFSGTLNENPSRYGNGMGIVWEAYHKGPHNWGTTFPKLPCLPSMKSAANHWQLPVAPFLDFDFGSWETLLPKTLTRVKSHNL